MRVEMFGLMTPLPTASSRSARLTKEQEQRQVRTRNGFAAPRAQRGERPARALPSLRSGRGETGGSSSIHIQPGNVILILLALGLLAGLLALDLGLELFDLGLLLGELLQI